MQDHLVRVGVLGQISRFQAADAARFARGTTVICRTERGLEVGTVLNSVALSHQGQQRAGMILRAATAEDHLLWARIEKHRLAAFRECQQLLQDRAVDVPLIDVELLFDGGSMFFYFVGTITPEIESMTAELAETYQTRIQLRDFAATLQAGCGPDCGSKEGGCSEVGCAGCAIAGACAR